jgi:hypothetical protein
MYRNLEVIMRWNPRIALALALLAAPVAARAGQDVNETRTAPADGVVEIENLEGTVTVEGWDRKEVTVTGRLSDGPERLEVTQDGKRTRVRVVWPRNHQGDVGESTTLLVRVPTGSRVEGEGVSSAYRVSGITGELAFETVSGEIHVTGAAGRVHAESVSGEIRIEGPSPAVTAEAVSGHIWVKGATGGVEAGTVSGDVFIAAGAVTRATSSSVSGDVEVEGNLGGAGTYEFESHSGDVTLRLSPGVSAEFEISTFSGDIESDFEAKARSTSDYGPGRELSFTTGEGEARIRVTSFSGNVRLIKRGA